MINRRSLITGLISLAAAPAIVRVESLMPVKVIKPMMIEYWNGRAYHVELDIAYGIAYYHYEYL